MYCISGFLMSDFQTVYDQYAKECIQQDINQYSINSILFKYRDQHWFFDYCFTMMEFLGANDIKTSHDEQKRLKATSQIRDDRVDKLTAYILKDLKIKKTNNGRGFSVPLAGWSGWNYEVDRDNNSPLIPGTVNLPDPNDPTSENTITVQYKFAPILLLYLRHDYLSQYQKLIDFLDYRIKNRNKLPPEFKGKDLEWIQISDTEWKVLVTPATRKYNSTKIWDSMRNERRYYVHGLHFQEFKDIFNYDSNLDQKTSDIKTKHLTRKSVFES